MTGPAGVTRLVVGTAVYGAVLFFCAGTIAWPAAWVYLAVMTVVFAVYMAVVSRHPDLIAERRKPPADAKRWDRPFVTLIGAVGPAVLLLVCGFDRRFGWSPPISPAWNVVGLLLVAAGGSLSNWAVAANRFFSAVVRIQRERGHHVIDSGPYRRVRHPGYVGSLIHMPGLALALGSLWALAVVGVISALLVVRTALEDRTLRAELEGYEAYVSRVRYRLLPGIW